MIKGIIFFITGLVFFLFGMVKLSAEIHKLLNNVRIRQYFKYSIEKPIYGVIVGIISTVLFQSSSATSALTVGMVSAGLISFYHSLGIILGADIGTTLTVQLVVWKFTDISPVFIVSSGILWLLGKGKWKSIGEAMFYFGLIFFGLSVVGQATAPLKNNPAFINFFQETKNPLLGVGVGLLLTAVVQASAIPISILVILAQQGLITIDNSLPIVFGANIGTAVTAILAGLVANTSGKRSALSHLLFKFFGAVICISILPIFIQVLERLSSNVAQQIALGHILFNLLIVTIFIFLLKPFSRLVEKILPGKEEVLPIWPVFLDEKHLAKAEDALECVKKEIQREIYLTQKVFSESLDLILNFNQGGKRNILYVELIIDNLRTEISEYLCKIPSGHLSHELSNRFFAFTAMANDIERIADHCVNMVNLSEKKYQIKTEFSEIAKSELAEIEMLVAENIKDAISLVKKRDEKKIRSVFDREEEIDLKVKEATERHLERFHKGKCQPAVGPIFLEILLNLERISDHCENIAEYSEDLKE
ncbi:MAG: Na/Pi cotransporter family protein [Thermodesulfobacteriota bacterium]|nr:Na/Pi cotransporter family protein [Thermodesulfobacteriota bacterium]